MNNSNAINYQELLQKYMQLVFSLEESTFMELANTPFSPGVTFTSQELQSLRDIENILIQENRAGQRHTLLDK